ncbi:MAG: hypothetical protein WCH39_27920, partial [Schlesneria sp.]
MNQNQALKVLAGYVAVPSSRMKCEQLLSISETAFGLDIRYSANPTDDRLHSKFRTIGKRPSSEEFAATATIAEISLTFGMQTVAQSVLSSFAGIAPDSLASATHGERLRHIADRAKELGVVAHSWWLESSCRMMVSFAALSDRSRDAEDLRDCFFTFLGGESSLETLEELSNRIHPAVFFSLVRAWHQILIAVGHHAWDPLYHAGFTVNEVKNGILATPYGDSWYTARYRNLRTALVASLSEESLSDAVTIMRHTNLPFRKIPPGPCQYFVARMLLLMHANECSSQAAEQHRQETLRWLIFDCLDEHLRPQSEPKFYAPAVKAT